MFIKRVIVKESPHPISHPTAWAKTFALKKQPPYPRKDCEVEIPEAPRTPYWRSIKGVVKM